MALTIAEEFLPATLTAPPMSDEEFLEFCSHYPDHFIESTAEGEILVMPPTHWITGIQGNYISGELGHWARKARNGFATDAASGFFLPNGARRSPDAAWLSRAQLAGFDRVQTRQSWHICPLFVIELRSQSDRLRKLRAKMQEWTENGAELGWLIDSERRAVEVYRLGREPEIRTGIDAIEGEGCVSGFTLDLLPVWDPLA